MEYRGRNGYQSAATVGGLKGEQEVGSGAASKRTALATAKGIDSSGRRAVERMRENAIQEL